MTTLAPTLPHLLALIDELKTQSELAATDADDPLTSAGNNWSANRAAEVADELRAALRQLFALPVPTKQELGPQPLWDIKLNTGRGVHKMKGNIPTDVGLPAWMMVTWASAPQPTTFPLVLEAIRNGVESKFPGAFDQAARELLAKHEPVTP